MYLPAVITLCSCSIFNNCEMAPDGAMCSCCAAGSLTHAYKKKLKEEKLKKVVRQ